MSDLPDYIKFTDSAAGTLIEVLDALKPDKVAILVDENSERFCLSRLSEISQFIIIRIESGEQNKNITTCSHIWSVLTENEFSRKSVLVNVGGGVIGDMGGFAAVTFKRGIRFINIPTTLLSQVDASIGGKLGIDFNGLKNHIGIFREPTAVILDGVFLETLPINQLRSGYAEIIKHGLIADRDYWEKLKEFTFPEIPWDQLLHSSVLIKNRVVLSDPFEKGNRKILNFGHTVGHAIETWYLENNHELLHGEAVAIGMIMEAKIGVIVGLLDESVLTEILIYIKSVFGLVNILPDTEQIIDLMLQDKKNVGDTIMLSIVSGIGKCEYDVKSSNSQIAEAIEFYRMLK